MTANFISSVIIGAIVAAVTGMWALFLIVAGALFILGLPFALISSAVHDEVSYAQDRADYRQMMAELHAEELAEERELAKDLRLDRKIKASKNKTAIYNDNRQVRLYEVHP